MNLASILQQPLGQHNHCVWYGWSSLAIIQTLVTVQHKCSFLVCIDNLLSEISALYCGCQVYLTSGQPPQHDSRYAEVDRIADVTLWEVHRTTTVQYEQLTLVTGRQFGGQPFTAHADIGQHGRIIFSRHFESWWVPTAKNKISRRALMLPRTHKARGESTNVFIC